MSHPIDTARVAVVPDFTGFESTAKREIDIAMREAVAEAQRAFAQVDRAATEAGHTIATEFRKGGAIAEQSIREVSNQGKIMAATVTASSAEAGTALGGRLAAGAAAAKAALLGVGLAVGTALAGITAFGLKSAAQLEQTQIGFESLLGSAADAKNFISQLQSFAAVTPFQFAGVSDAARRILAFGQAAGITKDQVIPTLTTIGDLVSVLGGTQESIDAVIRAMGQMSSSGRLLGGDVLQIAQALPGFDVMGAIAKHMGITTQAAMQLREQGLIPSQVAIQGILDGMAKFPGAAGAMEKQSQTLLGLFSTFKDTVAIGLTTAFQPVIPAIKQSLADITPVIGDAVNQLAPALGGLLAALLPVLGTLIKAITPILVPLLDLITKVLPKITPLLQPIGDAVGAVVEALAPLVQVLIEGLAPVIAALTPVAGEIAPALVTIVQALLPLIPPLSQILVSLAPLIVLLAKLAAWLAELSVRFNIAPVVGVLADQLTKLAGVFQSIGTFLSGIDWHAVLQAFPDALKAIGSGIINSIAGWRTSLQQGVVDIASWLLQAGKDLITGLWNGISSMGGWLAKKVGDFVYANTVGKVKGLLGIGSPSTVAADEIGRWFPAGIQQGVQENSAGLLATVAGMVGDIAAITGRGQQSSNLTVDVGGVVVNGGASVADARVIGQQVGRSVVTAGRRAAVALGVRMRG